MQPYDLQPSSSWLRRSGGPWLRVLVLVAALATPVAFAAYNAGPENLAKMRTVAPTRGLDPDQWFNNIEVVTADKDRYRNDHIRAQHLQVLRRLQAHAGRAGGGAPGARTGHARDEGGCARTQRDIRDLDTERHRVTIREGIGGTTRIIPRCPTHWTPKCSVLRSSSREAY